MTPTPRSQASTTNQAAAEPQENQTAAEPQEEQGFIEYLGEDKYGTEFIDARVISRKDAKDGWDISIPKDLRWTKDRKGRMRLPLAEVPVEVRETLLEDKAFRLTEQ